ncbi:MAG: phospholipase D-like domain-containing protein, partial [Blastocatellia bacterium]
QNTVQFSGADYGPFFFVPATPYQNYIDESIYFSTDSAVVDSFQTQYDNLWTDTVNYGNYANIDGSLTRSYPTSPISHDMNFPPDNTNPLNDFGSRTVDVMSQEKQKIDAEIYRITNTMFTNVSINAVSRGVPMRLLTEPEEYRNVSRLWDSYNVDLMFMGGVQIKQTKHQGLNHQKSMLLYGQGMTVWGSSNWTGPSADCQAEHNYFNTSKPWFFKWLENQFERKWNSTVEYEPFIPLPPDPAANFAPANNATGQPLTVTLTCDGGPWSQKFDIYFGTTATPPLVASDVLTGDPKVLNSRVFQVSGLLPNTTYHWQVVDKTMANLTAAGPVWSFTTGAGPTPTSTPAITT